VQNKLDVEAAMDPGGPVSIKGVNPWFSAHVRLPLLLSSLFLGTRGEHSTFPSTKKKKRTLLQERSLQNQLFLFYPGFISFFK
jgi:hypothetical protein